MMRKKLFVEMILDYETFFKEQFAVSETTEKQWLEVFSSNII